MKVKRNQLIILISFIFIFFINGIAFALYNGPANEYNYMWFVFQDETGVSIPSPSFIGRRSIIFHTNRPYVSAEEW